MTGARALVLDCDGVLADTERYGHLVAFNETFAEFGLPVRWSVADYRDKLRIGGGKERMASLLTPEFVGGGRVASRSGRTAGRDRELAQAEDGDLHAAGYLGRRAAALRRREDRRRGHRRWLARRGSLHIGRALRRRDP